MKITAVFFKAVLAGIAIAIGGTVYLAMENKVVGAVLFATGLCVICTQGLFLYTGKIGYLTSQEKKDVPGYLIQLLVTFIGNYTGTILVGLYVGSGQWKTIAEAAAKTAAGKAEKPLWVLFIAGILCGILVYAAVDGYKKTKSLWIIVFCIAAFILCGYEHCVADMFYFAAAGVWSLKAVLVILAAACGNSVGSIIMNQVISMKESRTLT